MVKKEKLPKELIEELRLKNPKKEKIKVRLIKEPHQVRIPIPKKIKNEIEFEKYNFCLMEYEEETKKIICKLVKNA